MRLAFRLAIAACIALALAGCGRSASYRYKLTLSLNTPEGVVSGFNVVEVRAKEVSIPARGAISRVTGEALYLDLGPGKRPLVALLTRRHRPLVPRPRADPRSTWGEDDPAEIIVRLYSGIKRMSHYFDTIDGFANFRGPRAIEPFDLPDLVTFADVNDPRSVIAVNPDDLGATLGPGVSWRALTIEATDEPLTTGIEAKLPWVKDFNDAFYVKDIKPPDNFIGRLDFKKENSL